MNWKNMAAIMAAIYGIMAMLPFFLGKTNFVMHILIMCLIWAVVASCWDLIMGFAGIFSFGQVAFFVIGAYASAIVSNTYHVSPAGAILLAGGFTAAVGILVGLPCLRLKGAYVALVTFAVHMTLEPLLKGDFGRAIGTGGSRGIMAIAPLKLFGVTFSSADPVPFFYLTLIFFIICTLIILFVIKSYWGTAFVALKDSENLAASLGISAFKYKLTVFALTSFITGLAGGFYCHYVGMLSHRLLGVDLFVTLMVMLAIGGIGHYPGAIIGAFITVTLNELLAPLGTYRPLIIGILIILLVLLFPDGIIGLVQKVFTSKADKATKPVY
ncbi:MAG: branched-chain amino acid ABC transporter permease [Desulfobacteraceae bacterium]|nr:branched-chain amino acid ABC transporter permease [Desulfobacteraceae bacterium]